MQADLPPKPEEYEATVFERPAAKKSSPLVGIGLGIVLGVLIGFGTAAALRSVEPPASPAPNTAQVFVDAAPCVPNVIIGVVTDKSVGYSINGGETHRGTMRQLSAIVDSNLKDAQVGRKGKYMVITGFACPDEAKAPTDR